MFSYYISHLSFSLQKKNLYLDAFFQSVYFIGSILKLAAIF